MIFLWFTSDKSVLDKRRKEDKSRKTLSVTHWQRIWWSDSRGLRGETHLTSDSRNDIISENLITTYERTDSMLGVSCGDGDEDERNRCSRLGYHRDVKWRMQCTYGRQNTAIEDSIRAKVWATISPMESDRLIRVNRMTSGPLSARSVLSSDQQSIQIVLVIQSALEN